MRVLALVLDLLAVGLLLWALRPVYVPVLCRHGWWPDEPVEKVLAAWDAAGYDERGMTEEPCDRGMAASTPAYIMWPGNTFAGVTIWNNTIDTTTYSLWTNA